MLITYASTVFELVFLQLLVTNATLLDETRLDETCVEKYISVLRNEPLPQCPKGIAVFDSWRFSANSLLRAKFPIDSIEQNYVRKVSNVIFSVVKPFVLSDIKLVAVSSEALVSILDLDPVVKYDTIFLKFAAGNWIHPSGVYLAHRYGGHQVRPYIVASGCAVATQACPGFFKWSSLENGSRIWGCGLQTIYQAYNYIIIS